MKTILKQLFVGKIQSRNRILFFIYLNWQKLVNSNKLGYKSKAVKWHKIVYYYFFETGNGKSVLYCHGKLTQRKTENGAALRHNVKKKKKLKIQKERNIQMASVSINLIKFLLTF